MRKVLALTTVLLTGSAIAQNTTQTKLETKNKSNILKNVQLTLETETATKRDKNNDIKGTETYYKIEPGYKLNEKTTAMVGAQYNQRHLGGTEQGSEAKNHDALEEVYAKVLYKASKFKDNGISDLRLQARVYSRQNEVFKARYAADGNYQLRAYFGRPLAGGFFINKYTSYLRYKNYFNNGWSSDYSRDHELRARISPTYRLSKGLDLGTTISYNHIFMVNKTPDQENVTLDLSTRYQTGPYAIMGRVGFEMMNNQDGSTVLKTNEDAGKEFGYALTFTAYL